MALIASDGVKHIVVYDIAILLIIPQHRPEIIPHRRAFGCAGVLIDTRSLGRLGVDPRAEIRAVPIRRRHRADQPEHIGAQSAVSGDQSAERRTHDTGVHAVGQCAVGCIDVRPHVVDQIGEIKVPGESVLWCAIFGHAVVGVVNRNDDGFAHAALTDFAGGGGIGRPRSERPARIKHILSVVHVQHRIFFRGVLCVAAWQVNPSAARRDAVAGVAGVPCGDVDHLRRGDGGGREVIENISILQKQRVEPGEVIVVDAAERRVVPLQHTCCGITVRHKLQRSPGLADAVDAVQKFAAGPARSDPCHRRIAERLGLADAKQHKRVRPRGVVVDGFAGVAGVPQRDVGGKGGAGKVAIAQRAVGAARRGARGEFEIHRGGNGGA